MSDTEFLGMLVVGIATLGGLIGTITIPIVKLNNNITTLGNQIDRLGKEGDIRDRRLKEHGKQLDEHEKILARHQVEIEHIKGGH